MKSSQRRVSTPARSLSTRWGSSESRGTLPEGTIGRRLGDFRAAATIAVLPLALAACQHTPEARVETVEVKVPVAVQPITKDQVPPLPGQLGPRPDNARDAADIALAGRCEALAFVIRAYPLLLLSAGLPPAQAPDYPECDKK